MTAPVGISSTNDVEGVLDQHRFDEQRLEDYLKAHVAGYASGLNVRQFQGGMSNPTFLLTDGNGTRYVMRKKPPGILLPSAHAVDREFKVIAALADTDVPVGKAYALCEDDDVIGQTFYVMEHVEGRVIRDFSLPAMSPTDRAAHYDAMCQTLAKLHAVDWRGVGLESYGREGGYCARQVGRWSKQYEASKTDDLPKMDKTLAWLNDHMPTSEETTIVHGDYRMENTIYHETEPRILAIIDWELGTLGDPLSDLAYNCLNYHYGDASRADITGIDFENYGIPTEEAYVARYCELTGRDSIPDWTFYLVLSLYRLAAIVQGVYKRGLDGNASSPEAIKRKDGCRNLSDVAWRLIEERG